jgi:hypothetical protein
MFKTISAALLAVSVLAAPAFAATTKTTQKPAQTTTQAPVTQAAPAKPNALNANAKMAKHHKVARHHIHHKNLAVKRVHHHTKVGFKHAAPTVTKRG